MSSNLVLMKTTLPLLGELLIAHINDVSILNLVFDAPLNDTSFRHQWTFPRGFHVSPFNDRSGHYTVCITPPSYSPLNASARMTKTAPGHPLPPKVRVNLLSVDPETTLSPSSAEMLKLTATMEPQAVHRLSSPNLVLALLCQPLVLFLSLPRILLHASILHYQKRLPVYPRPEPHAVVSGAEDRIVGAGVGVGWQSETWTQKLARTRVESYLERRVAQLGVSVTLSPGNPAVPRRVFRSGESESEEGEPALTISYLSPAFFTAMFASPSAKHALLLGEASKLFSPSSRPLFLRVFNTQPEPAGCRSVSAAQHLRLHALPHHLRDNMYLPVPTLHPLDSPGAFHLHYAVTLLLLLYSNWSQALEEWLYRLFRVKFATGEEPWGQWDRAIKQLEELATED